MIRFKHIGCKSEIIRYVGVMPIKTGLLGASANWELPNGKSPLDASDADCKCADCGSVIDGPLMLEEMQ